MIFVDANVFLRHLVTPATPQDVAYARRSAVLFRRVEQGKEVITTSEATVAEVVFILSAKRHYNSPRTIVVTALKPLLRPTNCRLAEKAVCLRALDLWEAHPRLSFPDALGAAYSEQLSYELATFDERLNRLPGLTVYMFPEPGQDDEDETDSL